MDRVDLLLAQLNAAARLLAEMDEPQLALTKELREAMQEATVCAYRLRLGMVFKSEARTPRC